ncbi:hypothetical protein, partial [Cetobacterium sp.]|uniref:hypothetical protein n=1 Tax=Cetobacterium sp. TaxID=2071632 RepID=UPI003EE74C41
VLILDGFIDFIFGIVVTLSMYLAQGIFYYILLIYILMTSILTIIFGLASKYSLKVEKIEEEKEIKEIKEINN